MAGAFAVLFKHLVSLLDFVSSMEVVSTLTTRWGWQLPQILEVVLDFIVATPAHWFLTVAGLSLVGIAFHRSRSAAPPGRRLTQWSVRRFAGLGLLALIAIAVVVLARPSMTQFTISSPRPRAAGLSIPVISPNGRYIAALVANRIYVWSRLRWKWEPWSLGGSGAFWSSDSHYLAYRADDGFLKKVCLSTRKEDSIARLEGENFGGGSWSSSDGILAAVDGAVIYVDKSGADRPILGDRSGTGEFWFGNPRFLPDGRCFLYTARLQTGGSSAIYLASLDALASPSLEPIGECLVESAGSHGEYVEPGYLLFALPGSCRLAVKPLDASCRLSSQDQSEVGVSVDVALGTARGAFSASARYLVYFAPTMGRTQLERFDQSGVFKGVVPLSDNVQNPEVSSDGSRVVVERRKAEQLQRNLWLLNIDRKSTTQLTKGPRDYSDPVWSPNGSRVVCTTDRPTPSSLVEISLRAGDFGAQRYLPLGVRGRIIPNSWSPNGTWMLIRGSGGLWRAPVDARPGDKLVPSETAGGGQISPNGKWILYQVAGIRRRDVVVGKISGEPSQFVSENGGYRPRWRPDGKAIFFVGPDRRLMVSDFTDDRPEEPRPLFRTTIAVNEGAPGRTEYFNYAVMPKRPWDFLIVVERERPRLAYGLRTNWRHALNN